MSAALQLPLPQLNTVWAASTAAASTEVQRKGPGSVCASAVVSAAMLAAQAIPALGTATLLIRQRTRTHLQRNPEPKPQLESPVVSYAFYRKHTESLLKRYLYASIQIGRAPSLLEESVGRGWVSSRRVRTFEDAVIFVLDVERCLERLSPVDRQLISRIVLQEYTHQETASFLGVSGRTVLIRFPQALDRLTERLVTANLLLLPD